MENLKFYGWLFLILLLLFLAAFVWGVFFPERYEMPEPTTPTPKENHWIKAQKEKERMNATKPHQKKYRVVRRHKSNNREYLLEAEDWEEADSPEDMEDPDDSYRK
jgi:Na+-transporting methylmalonyl-CoA/oxaloacetate decarboxylase gamma subunit